MMTHLMHSLAVGALSVVLVYVAFGNQPSWVVIPIGLIIAVPLSILLRGGYDGN